MDQRLVLIAGFFLTLTCSCFAQLSAYSKADSVADLYRSHSLTDLKTLSYKLTEILSTDEEKFRSIYKWVCSNIATDNDLVDLHRAKRKELSGEALDKWNREMNTRMVKLLVNERKTLCTGYAWLVRELSKHAGIRCEIINGYGRRMGSNVGGTGFLNHSWNAVLLNDKWYLCDPTWSAGFIDGPTGTFKFQFEDAYFLADPELFVLSHYPVDTTWAFVENVPSMGEFLNGPVIFAKALTYGLKPFSPSQYKITAAKNEKILFELEDQCERYQVDHIFKRRGVFPFHILLDTHIIASYEVTVR